MKHISRYYVRQRNRDVKKRPATICRRFPKLALLVDCKSHLILATHFERGPGPDINHLRKLLETSLPKYAVQTLAADAGYDAEWVHEFLRDKFRVRTLIPPRIGRYNYKPPKARYRRWMYFHLHHTRYTQRWQAETVFSMLKRRLQETLQGNTYWSQSRAASLKVLTHNILILAALLQWLFYRAM